jgi:pilus assembly protein Flp/PilA
MQQVAALRGAAVDWLPTCFGTSAAGLGKTETTHLERTEMKNLLTRLWKEEEGQDLTEYALLLVLVALAAVAALPTLASAINNVFSSAASSLQSTAT